MSETLSQNSLPMSQPFFGSPKFLGHLRYIPTADILEFTSLEQIPNPLLWIEIGRIARQALQMESFGRPSLQKVLDPFRPMDRRTIPNHQQFAGDLAQEQTQETHHIRGTVAMILHLHEESTVRGDPPN